MHLLMTYCVLISLSQERCEFCLNTFYEYITTVNVGNIFFFTMHWTVELKPIFVNALLQLYHKAYTYCLKYGYFSVLHLIQVSDRTGASSVPAKAVENASSVSSKFYLHI